MRSTNGPINAVYARVWDGDLLGKVRRLVTLHTLSRPKVELRASEVVVYVPAISTNAEDLLAYRDGVGYQQDV